AAATLAPRPLRALLHLPNSCHKPPANQSGFMTPQGAPHFQLLHPGSKQPVGNFKVNVSLAHPGRGAGSPGDSRPVGGGSRLASHGAALRPLGSSYGSQAHIDFEITLGHQEL
ncbi:hypothetical protein P7K49_040134, partial [Saguinus oedipus]